VHLADIDPDECLGMEKDQAEKKLARNLKRLAKLQYRLYAENRRALLIVLQAMDAGGKDGTIRHVMSNLNPQGCRVTPFKVPSAAEADHDYLWRIHQAVPPKGEIGVFNRSHYEEVLVVRVHRMVPKNVWRGRYRQINMFEEILTANNIVILKFFLHISRNEQKKRLEERLADPTRNWKFSETDLQERRLWKDYRRAYEDALTQCSSRTAPWFIIPANHKWFRNLAVSHIILETMEAMKMHFPKPGHDLARIRVD
jgi:PPK2 family polyphosphate:nucleotide phosphotransferase